MPRVRIVVRGRVQGVFFRVSTRDRARALGLGGWVSNLPDGRVQVTASGEDDSARASKFFGSAQLMTPAGPLPVSFEIEAENLNQAVEGFGPAAQGAIERTLEELKELQREQASSIVVPKGGVDPSSLGGGGIQMP